jgi:phage FluMu protein Com
MPIRFRCVHCDQLLGIARRKAGSVVDCPRCRKQLRVPQPEPAAEVGTPANGSGVVAPAPAGSPAAPIFERDDFDQLLDEPAVVVPPVPVPRPPAPVAPAQTVVPLTAVSSPVIDVEPLPPPNGLFLSRTMATVLAVSAVLALALAFAAGLFVGLLLRPSPEQKTSLRADLEFTSPSESGC